MLGYWATGRRVTAIAPPSMITSAMTHANMGRSMKKCATLPPSAGRAGCYVRCRRRFDGAHGLTGAHFLQPFDDHAIPRREPGADHPALTERAVGHHRPVLHH